MTAFSGVKNVRRTEILIQFNSNIFSHKLPGIIASPLPRTNKKVLRRSSQKKSYFGTTYPGFQEFIS